MSVGIDYDVSGAIFSAREGEAPAEPCLNVAEGSAGASPSHGHTKEARCARR